MARVAKAGPTQCYEVAIAGSADSGKIRLLNELLHGDLDPEELRYGDNRMDCRIDGARVVINFVHDMGKEHYPSMRFSYLSRAQGYLLVYESTSRASFEEAREIYLAVLRVKAEKAVESFYDQTPKYPTLLVANTTESEKEVQVSPQERKDLALALECIHFEVGGITDSSMFVEAVHQIVRLIREQRLSDAAFEQSQRQISLQMASTEQNQANLESNEPFLARKMLRELWRGGEEETVNQHQKSAFQLRSKPQY